ncbi:MAG: FAD-dependent oxidoreductase, partial [Clostridia bacterium]|nr:FAD-dependent oxidoreductase [Clostridia bacterium]
TAEGLEEITTGALRLMPSVNTRNAITSFSGVRPTPNIYDFYLKNSEQVPGVVHAVGVESPGFAASPAVAEYLVSLLQDAGLELTEKDNYIPTRRADGNHKQFNQMTDEERAAACRADSSYGKIICRCETDTEGYIIDAINAPIPANTVDMLKKRLRAGMGRCQGGFCSPRVAALIAQHSGKSLTTVTKCGGGSWLVSNRTE